MTAAPRPGDRRATIQEWLNDEAARRAALLPPNARCPVCGERDPLVLVPNHRRIPCADHDAVRRGQSPMQLQHIAGQHNGPWVVYVSANLHRRLTVRERFRTRQYA
jgi:hypothetical protein